MTAFSTLGHTWIETINERGIQAYREPSIHDVDQQSYI